MRTRLTLINIIGGILACAIILMILPPAVMASPNKKLDAISHRDIIVDLIAPPEKEEVEIPEGELPVSSITIRGSDSSHEGTGGVHVLNQTNFNPNYEDILAASVSFTPNKDQPQVLIMHTHATESFSENGALSYHPSDDMRSENIEENIVAAGILLAEELEKRGISVIHDRTFCDIPSFNSAYTVGLGVAEKALAEHPSIEVVIDLHRDSMVTSEGLKYRPITEIGGRDAAQIMLVVGTSQNGKSHENWSDNLSFAMDLHSVMNNNYPDIMRPLNLRADRFNQHLTKASLIVELGACGNSLEEALYSAQLLASGIAQVIG